MSINQRLSDLMSRQNLNNADLVRRAGLNHTYIHNIRRGKTKSPSFEKLNKIAKALGVSVEYLVGETDEQRYTGASIRWRQEYL